CMPEGGSPAWNPMYYQDGSPCDDGNPATINDTCEDGVCEGEEPPVEPDPEPDPEPKPEDQPEVVEPDPEPKPEDQPEGTEPDPEPKPEDQPEVVEPEEVAEFEAASEEGEEIDQPDKKPIEFSQESSEPRPEVVDANPEAVVAEELKGETPGANCGTCTFTRNFRGPLDLASGAAMIAFMAAAIATLRRKTRVVYEGPKAIETKPDRFKKVFRARLAQSLSRRNAPSL
ncbi:hypothetical protein HOE49_02030, partial [Candidatus Peregrinibacteria bacterium]|nr:hypothetical protein [Candidatus Peregrinibacteria bacterium]